MTPTLTWGWCAMEIKRYRRGGWFMEEAPIEELGDKESGKGKGKRTPSP